MGLKIKPSHWVSFLVIWHLAGQAPAECHFSPIKKCGGKRCDGSAELDSNSKVSINTVERAETNTQQDISSYIYTALTDDVLHKKKIDFNII